jgi:hypothetical protein
VQGCFLGDYQCSRVGFLANMLACDGATGPVLRVQVKQRINLQCASFVTAMRQGLMSAFPRASIGLAGAFQVKDGRIRSHVMPDFKKAFMAEGQEVSDWLKYYDVGPGATYLSTLLTCDPTGADMNLRLEHTHFFNRSTGDGGHYHYVRPLNMIGFFNSNA